MYNWHSNILCCRQYLNNIEIFVTIELNLRLDNRARARCTGSTRRHSRYWTRNWRWITSFTQPFQWWRARRWWSFTAFIIKAWRDQTTAIRCVDVVCLQMLQIIQNDILRHYVLIQDEYHISTNVRQTFSLLCWLFWESVRPRIWRDSAVRRNVGNSACEMFTSPAYINSKSDCRCSNSTSRIKIIGCLQGFVCKE